MGFLSAVGDVVKTVKKKHQEYLEHEEESRIRKIRKLDQQIKLEKKREQLTNKKEQLRELRAKNRGSSQVGGFLNNIGNFDLMGRDEKPKKKTI